MYGLLWPFSPQVVRQTYFSATPKVGPKRWRVELNARLDGVLMLSSVNLPGGIQVSSTCSNIVIRPQRTNDLRDEF